MTKHRRCYGCLRLQAHKAFSKSSRNKDGLLHLCRECNRAHVKAWQVANREKHRKTNRIWSKGSGRLTLLRWKRADMAAHPERYVARAKLNHEIRVGRLKRGQCAVCGSPRAEAHHSDYAKPLNVNWLCRLHHVQQHKGNASHGT